MVHQDFEKYAIQKPRMVKYQIVGKKYFFENISEIKETVNFINYLSIIFSHKI